MNLFFSNILFFGLMFSSEILDDLHPTKKRFSLLKFSIVSMSQSYDGWNLLLKNIQTHLKKIISHPKKNVDQLLNSLFTQGFSGRLFDEVVI
ncbi:hypothetical protein DEO72_LG8g1642 [Vigna unguiculata]|uniref:Uncharacterized protein n=1 Tax=Vigna unguiculata TaxID=3917 RepID=A0A4D6MUP6_VIGUN|nr:hypothetical protein DEO72_LG8g1642 [Vigna unguiculata]